MTIGSLFSGIGGFEIGFLQAGLCTLDEIKWQVEIDPFCNRVLERHFPNAKRYGDIRDVGRHNLDPVDLICGGVPCQPASCAGKRRGTEDDRWLWGEAIRVIGNLLPTWVVLENVRGIISLQGGIPFEQVLADLEAAGYKTATFVIPACAVNAPHRRDRVWIVGHSEYNGQHGSKDRQGGIERGNSDESRANEVWQFTGSNISGDKHAPDTLDERRIGRSGRGDADRDGIQAGKQAGREPWGATPRCDEDVTDTEVAGLEGRNTTRPGCPDGRFTEYPVGGGRYHENESWNENWYDVAIRTCSGRVDDGLSSRLDRLNRVNRLKALGNAVVPAVVQAIGSIIIEWEGSL